MATARHRGDSARTLFYKAKVARCLDALERQGLEHHQRLAVEAVGWSKLHLYVDLLTLDNHEDWTRFASQRAATVAVVAQAVARGRPSMPRVRDRKVQFRLPQ